MSNRGLCFDRHLRDALRASCDVVRDVLERAAAWVTPGATTDDVDRLVHEAIVSRGAYPSPLGYRGFPRSCFTSVNEVVCHGIPDDRPIEDGDIVNVDVSCYLGGYHGDASRMFLAGDVDDAVWPCERGRTHCVGGVTLALCLRRRSIAALIVVVVTMIRPPRHRGSLSSVLVGRLCAAG